MPGAIFVPESKPKLIRINRETPYLRLKKKSLRAWRVRLAREKALRYKRLVRKKQSRDERMVGKKLLLEWLREWPCDKAQRSEKKTKRPAHHGTEEVTAEVRRVLGSSYTPKIKTKASQKEIQQKRREHAEKMRRSQKEQEASGSKWKPGSRNIIHRERPRKAKQEKERKKKLESGQEFGNSVPNSDEEKVNIEIERLDKSQPTFSAFSDSTFSSNNHLRPTVQSP